MMNELGGLAQYVVDNAGKLLCLIDIGGIRPNVARHIRIQRCQYKGSRFILVATPQIGVEYGGGEAVYGCAANFRPIPRSGPDPTVAEKVSTRSRIRCRSPGRCDRGESSAPGPRTRVRSFDRGP